MLNFQIFDILGHTVNNSTPWLLQNKSEVGTLAGTKFFMFIGKWLAVDFYFCHTKAIYGYYKSMNATLLL